MKNLKSLIACVLAGTFFLFGCSEESISPPAGSTQDEAVDRLREQAEPLIAEIDALDEIAGSEEGGIGHWIEGDLVELPAGSVDALANAILAAGEGGIVRVKSGMHTESDGITITQAVRIVGEPGAVMQIGSDPYTAYPGTLDPALHVQDVAGRVVIWGLELIPASETGGVGVLLENSPVTVVGNSRITGFQIGIYSHHADNAKICSNVIETSTAWQTGAIPDAYGIVVANGDNVAMKGNDVSLALFGIWQCDGGAVYKINRTHDNLIGFILCKVPAAILYLPGGGDAGSENSGHDCLVMGNISENNDANGYLVIDSASNNVLLENDASNNGTYDIELAGDSYRFGFLTPACYDNVVIAGRNSNVIKDCGNQNTVVGGTVVDNELDPCY